MALGYERGDTALVWLSLPGLGSLAVFGFAISHVHVPLTYGFQGTESIWNEVNLRKKVLVQCKCSGLSIPWFAGFTGFAPVVEMATA